MSLQVLSPTDHSDWGYVSVSFKDVEKKFSHNIKTNEIFNHDPVNLIRLKCVGLTAATPLLSLARAVYWLANSIFVALEICYYDLDGKKPTDNDGRSLKDSAWEIPRALTFGASMTKMAFLGIFNPLENREAYGKLERELNHHSDGRPHRNKLYLAICFQPLAKMPAQEASSELVEVANKLNRYLEKLDAMRSALKSRNLTQLWVAFRRKI